MEVSMAEFCCTASLNANCHQARCSGVTRMKNSRETLFKIRAPENRSHHGLARARCREQRTPQENRTKAKSNERTAVKAKVHTGEMQGLQASSCFVIEPKKHMACFKLIIGG